MPPHARTVKCDMHEPGKIGRCFNVGLHKNDDPQSSKPANKYAQLEDDVLPPPRAQCLTEVAAEVPFVIACN